MSTFNNYPKSSFLQFNEDAFQLRTKEAHADHCADLSGPLHSHIAKTYGVTNNAVLNSCSYFHVINGIVPDIMHDILEGTLPLTTKMLLNHLITEEKLFTLSVLNERIAAFKYGPSKLANKPSPISDSTLTSLDTKIKQSGTKFSLFIHTYMYCMYMCPVEMCW